MLREQLAAKGVGHQKEFRWRGEVSRLEGFSDAVFAFALTLIVVSLEVPKTFNQLLQIIVSFPTFACCFAVLTFVWYRHYLFFRRYGLEDGLTVTLNLFLLFVVLFYIYPLKFLFVLMTSLTHRQIPTVLLSNGEPEPMIAPDQIPSLVTIYGSGFAAVFFIFGLLYLHAYRKRKTLDLNELEIIDTQESIWSNFSLVGIGLTSVVMIRWGGVAWTQPALMLYFLISITETVVGGVFGSRRRRVEARLLGTAPPPRLKNGNGDTGEEECLKTDFMGWWALPLRRERHRASRKRRRKRS